MWSFSVPHRFVHWNLFTGKNGDCCALWTQDLLISINAFNHYIFHHSENSITFNSCRVVLCTHWTVRIRVPFQWIIVATRTTWLYTSFRINVGSFHHWISIILWSLPSAIVVRLLKGGHHPPYSEKYINSLGIDTL